MAITTQPIGNIGSIRGYATNLAQPNVAYKLPPVPNGWTAIASGPGTVTIEWLHPTTRQVLHSFTGNRNITGAATSANPGVQALAATIGIGVRFTGVTTLHMVGIAPIEADGDTFATPPTL